MSNLHRLIFCAALLTLAACGRLEPPEASGTLVVAIRETPAFFQEEGSTTKGFEHDLATAFADSLGLQTKFVMAADPYDLVDLALAGRVHMAASMPLSNAQLEWSSPIRSAAQWIVGHRDALAIRQLSDLAGREVEVLAGSPLADTLRGLEVEPHLRVIEISGVSEMDLLERLAERKSALVAVHQVHLDLGVNFFPDVSPMLQLPGTLEFGWAFGGETAIELRDKANDFIANARAEGTLARLHDRYFGHIKRINSIGIAQFLKDVRSKLPLWRRSFQLAQDMTGIDWRLLAALSYQESHWDPLATSFTGVRGIMMLTEDTADLLRVKNRLDPEESIQAGARYLADLVEQIPAGAKYPDRLWLALSAYNLGMGHFRGARYIATTMKRNPDDWYDMKKVLPRLSRPEVYSRLKSGAARGGEAVIMVENIRSYYDILSRIEAVHKTPYAIKAKLSRR